QRSLTRWLIREKVASLEYGTDIHRACPGDLGHSQITVPRPIILPVMARRSLGLVLIVKVRQPTSDSVYWAIARQKTAAREKMKPAVSRQPLNQSTRSENGP